MALEVEDGSGMPTAEAYVSVSFADAWVAKYATAAQSAAWAALDGDEKELALRRATLYLDRKYGDRWKGVRGSIEQALDWPRVDAWTSDGYALDHDDLPQALEAATVEAALLEAAGEDLLPTVPADSSGMTSLSQKVGDLEETTAWANGRPSQARYPALDAQVRQLVLAPGEVTRA